MKVFSVSYVVAFLVLVFLSGCATKTVYIDRPSPPPKPMDTRQPTQWQTESREYSRPQFSVSATFAPSGTKLVIRGHVQESEYLVAFRETRDVPVQRYSVAHGAWLQEWRTERRTLQPQRQKWTVTSLRITNPYGNDQIARVAEDGSFVATLDSDGSVFFTRPPAAKYMQAAVVRGKTATVVPNGLPSSLSTSAELVLPDVYQIVANRQLAEEFVRNHIANFVVVCYDQNSRTPIMPRLQVLATEGITEEGLRALLTAEFVGNQELIRAGLDVARGLLFKGDKRTSITQDMSFKVWTGTSLKISVTHPEYYFFEANVDADKAGRVRKNILLIEKGKKVRVDNVNEGQGGRIVDHE